jgi:hypothetical protein
MSLIKKAERGNKIMATFEARIWEKAEHWYFDVKIDAANETAARVQLLKDYPRRSYVIREVRSVWSARNS